MEANNQQKNRSKTGKNQHLERAFKTKRIESNV